MNFEPTERGVFLAIQDLDFQKYCPLRSRNLKQNSLDNNKQSIQFSWMCIGIGGKTVLVCLNQLYMEHIDPGIYGSLANW